MTVRAPHFLLYSDSRSGHEEDEVDTTAIENTDDDGQAAAKPQNESEWHFLLQSIDGEGCVQASDIEPEVRGERLELLSVVRGLEALDQPSRVTLLTPSRYVQRGFRFGMREWKSSQWRWERFGKMVPVKNGDLWRRVDRALEYHKVECRQLRFDRPHLEALEMVAEPAASRATVSAAESHGVEQRCLAAM